VEKELKERIERIGRATHANSVLVRAARLDNALQAIIEIKMPQLTGKLRKKLFTNANGPISSFSAKIDIAYVLGIIEHGLYVELNKVREIRNEFAHAVDTTHFELPKIIEMIKRFEDFDEARLAVDFFNLKADQLLKNLRAIKRKLEEPDAG
jgi:DNA-binding MltR family transcriptional regulator